MFDNKVVIESDTINLHDNKQKITEVKSCSDCCMTNNPDGTFNVVGYLFRQNQTKTISNIHGTYSYTDCKNCPITQNMSDEEFARVLADIDGCE